MRRVPPRQTQSIDIGQRSTSKARSRSRLQRLQVMLLVVLGLWFIDSGMSAQPDLPRSLDVSAGPVPAVEEPATHINAVQKTLADVNPGLTPSELSRITTAVFRYSEKYGLDPELVTAVVLVESGARPWVRSSKGAVGLMQVMPHMMEPLGLTGNAATIESNIEAGCWILASNIRRLGEEKGISTYFWGSDIRGLAYLEKVQSARAEVRRHRAS
ncbi:MAG: transglycosylase SLT domain-containing protein [Myxococcota bacterium]